MINFELQKAKKKIRQAIDGKYAQKTVATVAAAVGTRHVAIDGNLASATLPDGSSGAVEVINAGRLASARYELRTGGTVSVVSGGGGGSGGGSGISFSEADTRYYTKSQLDIGQLDIRYYTEAESDALFVPLDRTVTGTGALGNGGALSSNQTITMNTPGSLTATSTNNSAVTNHTHAIDSTIARSAINLSASGLGFSGGGDLTANRSFTLASSSNPGAAAAILATSAGGTLTLNNNGSTTTPALVIGDGSTGRLAIGSSGWRDNATKLEMLGARTLWTGDNDVAGTNWSIASGVVSALPGTQAAHTFSLGTIGNVGHANYFGIAATPFANPTDYALLHGNSDGRTFLNAATGTDIRFRIANTDTMIMDANGLEFVSAKSIGTDNYVSQSTGWRIDYAGGGDFRYVYTDELHAKSFIADLEQALAGGQIICKSVAVLAVDFTAPAAGGTATLRVKDLPSAANMATFQSGDIVRLRSFNRSGGGLSIADCWGVATAYVDQSDGTQTWTFTRSTAPNAGAMTAGTVVNADAIVLDYGTSGNGFYEVNAIDGIYAANSPYAQVAKWTGHPATGTTVTGRFGKLSGLAIGVANEFGIAVGSGFTTSDAYFKASNVGVTQNNVDSTWKSGGTDVLTINPTSGISLRTYDATGGLISWGDQRIISWAESIGAATPDGAMWSQRTATQNEFYIEANQVGSRAGWIRLRARGELISGNAKDDAFLEIAGAESTATRSYAKLTADDFTIDLGNGSANIGNMTLYNAQLLISDGSANDDGSAVAPIYSFSDDPDTGIYRAGANQINFTTSGVERMAITATSVSAFWDTDTTHTFGRVKIGYVGHGDYAAFAHYDQANSTSFALLHQSDGRLHLNGASGTDIYFKIGNSAVMRMTSSGLNVGDGSAPAYTLDVRGRAGIRQLSTTGAVPTLILTQSDVSEEFIDFSSTVGAGNAIDTAALGTYYGKIRVAVNGTFKYMALYNS